MSVKKNITNKCFKIILFNYFYFFNINNVFCCKKCKDCCKKLCNSDEKKKLDDKEKEQLKDFIFGVIFHGDDKHNFKFHDYITVKKLEDNGIKKKIDPSSKKGDIYVLDVDLTNLKKENGDEFSENEELDSAYYGGKVDMEGKPYLKFSKKSYKEDLDNNKFKFLHKGKIKSEKYGEFIYYIENNNLCIYSNNINRVTNDGDKKTNFFYEGYEYSGKESGHEKIDYFKNGTEIVSKDQQLSTNVLVESPRKNKLVLTFQKFTNKQ